MDLASRMLQYISDRITLLRGRPASLERQNRLAFLCAASNLLTPGMPGGQARDAARIALGNVLLGQMSYTSFCAFRLEAKDLEAWLAQQPVAAFVAPSPDAVAA